MRIFKTITLTDKDLVIGTQAIEAIDADIKKDILESIVKEVETSIDLIEKQHDVLLKITNMPPLPYEKRRY